MAQQTSFRIGTATARTSRCRKPLSQVRHPAIVRARRLDFAGASAIRASWPSGSTSGCTTRSRKDITVGIPSAMQVLDTRRGDCNEHTQLFVALARAVGHSGAHRGGPRVRGRQVLLPRVARSLLRGLGRGGSDVRPVPRGRRAPALRASAASRGRPSCCVSWATSRSTSHRGVDDQAHASSPRNTARSPRSTRIDLEVPRGELFGFLGPNGAGKTTTLRMIAGILQPDGGTVRDRRHRHRRRPDRGEDEARLHPRPAVHLREADRRASSCGSSRGCTARRARRSSIARASCWRCSTSRSGATSWSRATATACGRS